MEKKTDGTMIFHTNAIKMHILKINTTDVCIHISIYTCTHTCTHTHTHTQMFYKFPRFNKNQNSRHQDKTESFDSNFLFNKESFASCWTCHSFCNEDLGNRNRGHWAGSWGTWRQGKEEVKHKMSLFKCEDYKVSESDLVFLSKQVASQQVPKDMCRSS